MTEDLKMAYDKRGRYYYLPSNPDKKMYSVSTLIHWDEQKGKTSDMAKVGTLAHYHVLKHLTKEKLEVPSENPYWMDWREVDQKIEDVMCMWGMLELEKVVEKWIAVEEAVYYIGPDFWYGGRLDGIARCFDKKVRMMDLKCGDEYPEYGMQLAGYVQAYEQMHPDIYIEAAWNLYCDVGHNYVKENGTTYDRNPHKVPRIKVWSRDEIDAEMVKFNEKVRKVFEGIV